jgi:nucleotide-binding universal stress UspA family protein
MGLFKKILFCTDFSQTADHAFHYALELAKTYGSQLIIFHSLHQPFYPMLSEPFVVTQVVDQTEDAMRQEAEKEIRRRYAVSLPEGIEVQIVVRSGTPSQEILRVIGEAKADLVVMGARGRSPLELLLFGSVAHRVVKRSPVPVLTVSYGGQTP